MQDCQRCSDNPEWGARKGGNLIGLTIHEVARDWRRLIDARLKRMNLSDSRWRVLKSLELMGGPVSQKEIAEFVGIGGPTLVRLLDSLERDDWVLRRTSESDRRVKLVELKPKADEMLACITSVCLDIQQEILNGVSEQDLAACHDTLLCIQERICLVTNKESGRCETE